MIRRSTNMNLKDITVIAKQHGIKTAKKNKVALIKAIQRDEGNFDCFATAYYGLCDQLDCLWRDDCFKAAKSLAK